MRKKIDKRKFSVIVKTDNYVFAKYKTNNLDNFFKKFIPVKFPNSRYANVYCNKAWQNGKQKLLLFTWGNKKGLEIAK